MVEVRGEGGLSPNWFTVDFNAIRVRTDGGVKFFAKEAQSYFPNNLDGDGQQRKYSHM